MDTPLRDLQVEGAMIGACFAMEGRPTYAAKFEAKRILELLQMYETRHGITPASKKDLGMHGHHHRLLLKLVLDGDTTGNQDWVTAAVSNILWSSLNHPGLGRELRARTAKMLRSEKRATMTFEIRDGALWFDVNDNPFPAEAKAMDAHFDPGKAN